MAYTKRTFKDRIAVGDDIYTVTDLGNSKVKLTPSPTSVAEPGSDINKAYLDGTENELAALDTLASSKATPGDISNAILNNTNGWDEVSLTLANFTVDADTTDYEQIFKWHHCNIPIPYNRTIFFMPTFAIAASNTYDNVNKSASMTIIPVVMDSNTGKMIYLLNGEEQSNSIETSSLSLSFDNESGASYAGVNVYCALVNREFVIKLRRFTVSGFGTTTINSVSCVMKYIQI